jgi:hypothetical protein
MDAVAILFDLKRRMQKIEARLAPQGRTRRIDPGAAALLEMHRTMHREEDRDIATLTAWLKTPLKTPLKKNAPAGQGEGNTTERNGNA